MQESGKEAAPPEANKKTASGRKRSKNRCCGPQTRPAVSKIKVRSLRTNDPAG